MSGILLKQKVNQKYIKFTFYLSKILCNNKRQLTVKQTFCLSTFNFSLKTPKYKSSSCVEAEGRKPVTGGRMGRGWKSSAFVPRR